MTAPVKLKCAGEHERDRIREMLTELLERLDDDSQPRLRSIIAITTDADHGYDIHDAGGMALAERVGVLEVVKNCMIMKARESS